MVVRACATAFRRGCMLLLGDRQTLEAEKSHETQIDFSMLEDVGLNAKHALVVINYFNKQLGDLHSVSELNSYCAGYLDKFKRVHFVMLHFEEGIDKDSMGFDERRRYDRALIPGDAWLRMAAPSPVMQDISFSCLLILEVMLIQLGTIQGTKENQ